MLELVDDRTTVDEQLPAGTSFTLTGDTEGTYYVIVSTSDIGVLAERHALNGATRTKQGVRFFTWSSGLVLVLPN